MEGVLAEGREGPDHPGQRDTQYFLYPGQRPKDPRIGHMTSNTQGVLDGNIQDFIDAELRRRAATRQK